MRYIFNFILTISVLFSACPDGFYEDNCGNCWMPYCYDAQSLEIQYDVQESECLGQNRKWIIPGIDEGIYFNNYCDGNCPENFMVDDCNHCWNSFCYSFFQKGLNGDPAHSVYYDLSIQQCESYGYNYYSPNHRFNPHWNYGCIKENENSKKQNLLTKISINVIIRLLAFTAVYLLVDNSI